MSLPVHLVPSLDGVAVGAVVEVTGDEAHHAVAVRRLRVGEQVVLTDGAGRSVTGAVTSTGKRVFTVEVATVDVGRTGRRRPSPWSRRCPRATAASSPSRCSPRWASTWSCRGPPPARWPSGRASAPRSRTPSGRPPPARPASSPAARGCRPCRRSRRPRRCATWSRTADLAVVLHEDATTPLAAVDVPAAGRIVVVVGPGGRHRPRRAGRPGVRRGAAPCASATRCCVRRPPASSPSPRCSSRTDRWR